MVARTRRVSRVSETASEWRPAARTYLLDVNVLIALLDPMHTHHAQAHDWFQREAGAAWATCPLTQNGVLRIVGHARYPEGPGSPVEAASILAGLCAQAGHQFWHDDVSLLDAVRIDRSRLLSHRQITDTYLLALAVKHGGKLATFDRRLVADAVESGKAALHLIA